MVLDGVNGIIYVMQGSVRGMGIVVAQNIGEYDLK